MPGRYITAGVNLSDRRWLLTECNYIIHDVVVYCMSTIIQHMHVYIDHEKVDLLVYLNYGAFNLNLGKCIYIHVA